MATFVLVHGAWHGGWCWGRVAKLLRAEGHDVYTPTLTGLADRSHLMAPTINLSTHVRDITNLITWEGLSDVVLVGHSYGGMVIAGVAEAVAKRLAAYVVIDGFVPEDGEYGFAKRGAKRNADTMEMVNRLGQGWRMPAYSAASFGVNAGDQAWVDSLLTDHPLACFTEPLRLTGKRETIARRHYIRAETYPNDNFAELTETLSSAPGWTVCRMNCGHDIMIDQPQELATELARFA